MKIDFKLSRDGRWSIVETNGEVRQIQLFQIARLQHIRTNQFALIIVILGLQIRIGKKHYLEVTPDAEQK